ncbi:putative prophage integrase [Neisseria animaloris]|uniref:Putative prophage integrase n=1 Tax=Neisseria animaloris TaxID=326522 RepID=A0A3S4ZB64_9NEIS|nr:putative prophage integrase [Neisseria animaloris]
MPLNDRQIKNLKPTDKIQKISDGGGLSLVCKPNGGKYWQLNFRFDGKQKTLSIGTYPAISLFEARAAREQAKQQLANGIDPAATKQQAKRQQQTAIANSFEKIAREWHQNQLPRWTGTHAARVLHSLETDAFPILGKYPVTEIKAPLLLEAVRAIEARGVPETATRVLQRIKSVFNYAIQTSRAVENPAFALSGVIVREKVKHQPALPKAESQSFTAV